MYEDLLKKKEKKKKIDEYIKNDEAKNVKNEH